MDLLAPKDLFEKPDQPIHLDIGCAKGDFLFLQAASEPNWNFLGLEIRNSLVVSAEKKRIKLGLNNLNFSFCNVNVSLEPWLEKLPPDLLQRVSVQFPDPWFKKRHKKRRIFQSSLLISLSKALGPGRQLFLKSDVLEIIKEITDLIELGGCFERLDFKGNHFRMENPFIFLTEREQYVLSQGLEVYRANFVRNKSQPSEFMYLEGESNKP